MKRVKIVLEFIIVLGLVLVLISNIVKAKQLEAEVTALEESLAETELVYSANEQALLEIQDIQGLKDTKYEVEWLQQWIYTPTEAGFEEAVKIAEKFGMFGGNARNVLFKRYINSDVTEMYMTYISGDGVRLYKASHLAEILMPQYEEWNIKNLYKPSEYSDPMSPNFIATTDYVMPEGLLEEREVFRKFMETMIGVFPNKDK